MKQNPFGQVTDEELTAYKQEIEMKNNPALYAEWLRSREEVAPKGEKSTLEAFNAGENRYTQSPSCHRLRFCA